MIHVLSNHFCVKHGPRLNRHSKSVSTFSHRYRQKKSPSITALRQALDDSIRSYIGNAHNRSFSHLYRKQKSHFPLRFAENVRHHSYAQRPHAPHGLAGYHVRNLIDSSYARTYAASYRAHKFNFITHLAKYLTIFWSMFSGSDKPQFSRRSMPEIFKIRTFSHNYRERQLAPLRAYLPRPHIRKGRSISSVPLLTHMTESESAGRNRNRLSWALRGLGAGLTVILALRYLQGLDQESNMQLNDSTYVPFVLEDIEKISPTTSIFTLRLPKDQGIPPLPPISSVSVMEPNANIQRPYTVLSCDKDTIKIMVKKYKSGDLSRYIHSRPVGGNLSLRQHPAAYSLPEPLPDRFLLIMGGTGVATAYQLVKHFAQLPESERPNVTLLYASTTPEEVYLMKDFANLREKYGEALQIKYFIDSEGTRIDKQSISEVVASERHVATLVCGSDGFITYVAGEKPEVGQGVIGGLLGDIGLQDVWKL